MKSAKQGETKSIVIKVPVEMWANLRRLSYELNISMADLCREGIDYVTTKHSKRISKKNSNAS